MILFVNSVEVADGKMHDWGVGGGEVRSTKKIISLDHGITFHTLNKVKNCLILLRR